jgi:hypothetical protein
VNKYILNTLGLTAILALCAIAWGAWRVGVLADSVKVPDISATVAKANGTLDVASATFASLSGPCKDFQGDYVCPPLTQLSQTEKNIGILAGQSALQVKQTGALVAATAQNLNTVGDSVKQVATAATDTLQQARTDLVTADGTIAAAKPVLNNLAATESDLDAAVVENRKNTASLIANGVTISGEVAGMSTDLHHYTHPILNPDPCKTKKCVAGRVAGRIESLLGVADTLQGAERLISPLKVKLAK